MIRSYKPVADQFADDCINGKRIVGKEIIAACERYKKDLQRDDLELRTRDPDLVINIMQTTLVHAQGEDLDHAGERLLDFVLEIASGKKTHAEERGAREIAIFKDGVTL